MRRAAKVDGNQSVIVEHLKAIGCSVQSLAASGNGVPDLLVGRRAVNVLIEVKDPKQDRCKRKLTPDQVDWHKLWRGQIAVVETPEQAEEAVKVAEKWAGAAC